MKSKMFTGLIVLGVAVVSGAIGFFLGKRTQNQRLAGLNEELEHLVMDYDDLNALANREIEKNQRLLNSMDAKVTNSLKKQSEDIRRDLRMKPDLLDLTRKYANPAKEVEEGAYDDDEEVDEGPHEISSQDADQYRDDSVTIDYYTEDHILVDETETPFDDPMGIVGVEVWETLCDREENEIYVYNPQCETMFEIIIRHGLSFF